LTYLKKIHIPFVNTNTKGMAQLKIMKIFVYSIAPKKVWVLQETLLLRILWQEVCYILMVLCSF